MVSLKKNNFKDFIYIGVGINLGDWMVNIRQVIVELILIGIEVC